MEISLHKHNNTNEGSERICQHTSSFLSAMIPSPLPGNLCVAMPLSFTPRAAAHFVNSLSNSISYTKVIGNNQFYHPQKSECSPSEVRIAERSARRFDVSSTANLYMASISNHGPTNYPATYRSSCRSRDLEFIPPAPSIFVIPMSCKYYKEDLHSAAILSEFIGPWIACAWSNPNASPRLTHLNISPRWEFPLALEKGGVFSHSCLKSPIRVEIFHPRI